VEFNKAAEENEKLFAAEKKKEEEAKEKVRTVSETKSSSNLEMRADLSDVDRQNLSRLEKVMQTDSEPETNVTLLKCGEKKAVISHTEWERSECGKNSRAGGPSSAKSLSLSLELRETSSPAKSTAGAPPMPAVASDLSPFLETKEKEKPIVDKSVKEPELEPKKRDPKPVTDEKKELRESKDEKEKERKKKSKKHEKQSKDKEK